MSNSIRERRSRVTRDHVLQAIRELRNVGVPKNREARDYILLHDGRDYPPKYVLEQAMRLVGPGRVEPEDHSGGAAANDVLTKLGFTIVRKDHRGDTRCDAGLDRGGNGYSQNPSTPPAIATVVVENPSGTPPSRSVRLQETEALAAAIAESIREPVVVVLPGGWLRFPCATDAPINDLLAPVCESCRGRPNLALVLGVDRKDRAGNSAHQRAAAVTSSGVQALARKIFPHSDEADYLERAPAWDAQEEGLGRIFEFHGRRAFLAVCYDVFGIKRLKPGNPRVDAVLSTVHGFVPKGNPGSGESMFARHGFAGASMEWRVPVFASAVFNERRVPNSWPSGVHCKERAVSTKQWSYSKNRISPAATLEMELEQERAVVRVFQPWVGGVS